MKHKTKKVFVGGVPTDMPEETIKEYFQQFGEVIIINNNKRRGRGWMDGVLENGNFSTDRGGCIGDRERQRKRRKEEKAWVLFCDIY